jgi:Flp pilus assembly protein TadD
MLKSIKRSIARVFHTSGDVPELEAFRDISCFVPVIIVMLGMTMNAAFAQNDSSRQTSEITIRGTVLDSAGKPVANAQVRLEKKGSPDNVTTDQQGNFVFLRLSPGTYFVAAEKAGLRSDVVTVSVLSPADSSKVNLILNVSAVAMPSTAAIVFADKPTFTVAGITDWTAVGGHGSDSSLRTSETLARETTSLKPEDSQGSVGIGSQTEAVLRAAVAASPKSYEANHQLGEFCLHKGSFREAIPPLETAYQIDPANRDNEYDLATAYKEAGDFTEAREHIQKLLALENTADLDRMAGDLDEASGDSVAAESEYETAVHLDPSELNYFAWGSELLLHRAVWPAAEVFKKGSEAHPKSARMLAALGAALFASAQYDEAALRLCEASDLIPADASPYVFLGTIDVAAPKSLPCVELKLSRFVREHPADARAYYLYAMAIWKRHKGEENSPDMQQVKSMLTKAVSVDPKYADAYLQLGNLYGAEHNTDAAIANYEKAIEVNPQLGEAHYRLGVAYEGSGKSVKAKQEFQLHDEIGKAQAASVERQRQEVKQFLVVLQGKPAVQ